MIKNSNDNPLTEKILDLRKRSLKSRKHKKTIDLNKPVSFWTKEDRLLNEIGNEFTIILRTRGCSRALSEYGGCSMCGYIQDAGLKDIPPERIINQFDVAIKSKLEEIDNSPSKYAIKLFNSGSFLDETEVLPEVRTHIYEMISNIKNISEVVIESRPEFVTDSKLMEIKEILGNKYVEIGIGLESADDYIRNQYINKGFLYSDFLTALNKCKEHDLGIKAYLILKPPFINELAAIDDCVNSIKILKIEGVNSISINPVNIQRGTLVEYLWYQNRYRPPWYYSLFEVINKSITQSDLKKVRLISDPSGAGSKRGIHNCLDRDCNSRMKDMLRSFVLNQDLKELELLEQEKEKCNCWLHYQLQKKFL